MQIGCNGPPSRGKLTVQKLFALLTSPNKRGCTHVCKFKDFIELIQGNKHIYSVLVVFILVNKVKLYRLAAMELLLEEN